MLKNFADNPVPPWPNTKPATKFYTFLVLLFIGVCL